jgi:hypothetical protein
VSEPAPQPAPNAKRDLITKFKDEYSAALADSKLSAEHTKTAGWKRLYEQHQQQSWDTRRDMAKTLKTCAQTLEDFGLNEDGEKMVKDTMKASAELRERVAAFQSQVIDRICEPVKACERIIEQYMNEARRQESDAPLHNVGLEHLMRDAVAKVAKPKWDADSGTVVVAD